MTRLTKRLMPYGPAIFLIALSLGIGLSCKPTSRSQVAADKKGQKKEKSANNLRAFVKIHPKNPTQLALGDKEYRFAGTNSYSMLDSKESALIQLNNAKALGLNVVRIWGFWNDHDHGLQPSLGNFNEDAWQRLDYILTEAGKRNIRLIIPLANYWDEFGGIDVVNRRFLKIYEKEQTEYHDREQFYHHQKGKNFYQNYVKKMLSRKNTITGTLYKNDPTILMWEPMNEARGRSDVSGQNTAKWLNWAAGLIKSLDKNHLVGTGTEGFIQSHGKYQSYPWQAGKTYQARGPDGEKRSIPPEGSYFHLNCSQPNIDVCSIHAWPYQWYVGEKPEDFMAKWVLEHIVLAKKLKKPLYMGEFGWQIYRKDGQKPLEQRHRVYQHTFWDLKKGGKKQLREGISGIGFWHIASQKQVDGQKLTHTVICPEDGAICQTIKEFAKANIRP